MIKKVLLLFLFLGAISLNSISLKEAFDSASPQGDYDKYMELNTGEVYTGGLLIGKVFDQPTSSLYGEEGLNIRIQGNGAILDLQGSEICISCCENYLDIEDCIIINGGIRYRGMDNSMFDQRPWGSVRYVTFFQPHDYGVRLQGTGQNITVERNIIVNAVDTGRDFIFTTGISTDWLPTGVSIALSAFTGIYGPPVIEENWTFHTDPDGNNDPLLHIIQLCEYG